MEEYDMKNSIISNSVINGEYISVYFIVGERMEIASFQPNQTTHLEMKELFRSAAEAGPLDIVKLRKGEKFLNISPSLSKNTSYDPYILQVVGAHPGSANIIEVNVLSALERRLDNLEHELRSNRDTASMSPSRLLQKLKKQVNTFQEKLETADHLSWLGFYKQLPEPISLHICRKLQYRHKNERTKEVVREKFFNICNVAVSSNIREWLRSPRFDAQQWEDEELLLMLQTMFIELELLEKFNIPLSTLRNFISEVYNNYNEVPFHNFRHCFCVAQMMYVIVWAVDLVSKIGKLEVLILIVSSICHDLDHPGYNNIYQINACTELALRYNDISPLENHHCSVAFQIIKVPECNIFGSLDSTTYKMVREGIIRCILATDMARHNEILAQFTDVVPDFDFSSKAHLNLLSMVLIKVADISNEARPMDVAEPWLDNLLQEFFKQSDAEKLEGLPVTPFMDRDKITKPSSQCSFIGLVLLPLFETLGELFPELQELIVEPVRYALQYYKRLNDQAKDERNQRRSIIDFDDNTASVISNTSVPQDQKQLQEISNVDKSSLTKSVNQSESAVVKASRSMFADRPLNAAPLACQFNVNKSSENLTFAESSDTESCEPETATEVEISEKTFKFKILTECSISTTMPGRKSHPGSRKGSHEKSSGDYYNLPYNRRESYNNITSTPVTPQCSIEPHILDHLSDCEKLDNLTLDEDEQKYNASSENSDTGTDRESKGTTSKDFTKDVVQCCCNDKAGPNNHKSLLSRLRNFTDRLNLSFDVKEPPILKSHKYPTVKTFYKSASTDTSDSSSPDSTGISSRYNYLPTICKKCNLSKGHSDQDIERPETTIFEQLLDTNVEKRSMTLPKTKRSEDCKNRGWRMVFTKDRRPSVSMESLPADYALTNITTNNPIHRRNLSNPEDKSYDELLQQKTSDFESHQNKFDETDTQQRTSPDLIDELNSSSSKTTLDVGKDSIRRSSASMEDISQIIKHNEGRLPGYTLEETNSIKYRKHIRSLDSILGKESGDLHEYKKSEPTNISTTIQLKKSTVGLFSRFKSSLNTDTSNNFSITLGENQTTGWISSIASNFRAKRQIESGHCMQSASSPCQEEIK